jgi:hypothetical protein
MAVVVFAFGRLLLRYLLSPPHHLGHEVPGFHTSEQCDGGSIKAVGALPVLPQKATRGASHAINPEFTVFRGIFFDALQRRNETLS